MTNKRNSTERARDRALIAEMHFKGGLNDRQIVDELNNREAGYTLSKRQVCYDREAIINDYAKAHEKDSDFWVTEAVMRTYYVEAAAWKGWEASLKPLERKTVKDGFHGDSSFEEVQKLHENRVGDKGFLKIILDAIAERNRLRGIGAARLHIKQDVQHTMMKAYAVVSPEDWDGLPPVNGDFTEVKSLSGGNDPTE